MSQKAPSSAPIISSFQKKIKTHAIILIFLFTYGMLGHIALFDLAPFDAIIQTISTFALHYVPASNPVAEAFQISLVLFGVIVIWWTVWTGFDLMVEGKFKEYFSEVKVMSDINKMQNHYIICGAGRVGIHTAKLLALEKKPFVLVDTHEADVENAKKKGFLAIKGDPFEEEVLMKCGLTHARALIAVMSETEKNILATLMAKQFNPEIKVYARTEKEELIKTLKKVGADHVIMPEAAGAIDISKAINRDEIDGKEIKEIQSIKTRVTKL